MVTKTQSIRILISRKLKDSHRHLSRTGIQVYAKHIRKALTATKGKINDEVRALLAYAQNGCSHAKAVRMMRIATP